MVDILEVRTIGEVAHPRLILTPISRVYQYPSNFKIRAATYNPACYLENDSDWRHRWNGRVPVYKSYSNLQSSALLLAHVGRLFTRSPMGHQNLKSTEDLQAAQRSIYGSSEFHRVTVHLPMMSRFRFSKRISVQMEQYLEQRFLNHLRS